VWVIVRQEYWVGGDDEVLAVEGPFETEAEGRAQLAVMNAALPAPPFRTERLWLMPVSRP
jgi:hypothetical protein